MEEKYSPEKIRHLEPNKLIDSLVQDGFFRTSGDCNMFIIEGLQNALWDGDEFPIRFYRAEEPMPEEAKIVDEPMLTDEYIANNL